MRQPLQPIANPGASATATILDTGAVGNPGVGAPNKNQRVRIAVFADVIVTIRQSWYAPGSSNKRTAATDVATTANAFKGIDATLWPGRNLFEVITTTGPTVFELGVEYLDQSS